MRDLTNRRGRIDALRTKLLAAWAEPNTSVEKIGQITGELRGSLDEGRVMNLIDDERAEVLRRALAEGASIRTAALHASVARGTVQRFKDEIEAAREWSPPTADTIAVAIIAAAKETGADPIDVAVGVLATAGIHSGKIAVSRARAYAALALRAVLDNVPSKSIATWVASGSPAVYIGSIDFQIRNKQLKWWDNNAFMRVVEAVESAVPEGVGR